MAHYGARAKLLKISSPSGRAGLVYRDHQRSFSKPDRHRLVWQSTGEKMAPGIVDAAFIQRLREEDPLGPRGCSTRTSPRTSTCS